jgi:large subunit ribosomal protein L29
MTATEIRDMTEAEIRERIEEIREELFRLRFRSATQALENPTLLKRLRRDLARLKTIQTERSSVGEE